MQKDCSAFFEILLFLQACLSCRAKIQTVLSFRNNANKAEVTNSTTDKAAADADADAGDDDDNAQDQGRDLQQNTAADPGRNQLTI